MLFEGMIPMEPGEAAAVQQIADQHPGESLTVTRRDPGETGPLLVHVGDRTFEIAPKADGD
jgi:hypothetical protein